MVGESAEAVAGVRRDHVLTMEDLKGILWSC